MQTMECPVRLWHDYQRGLVTATVPDDAALRALQGALAREHLAKTGSAPTLRMVNDAIAGLLESIEDAWLSDDCAERTPPCLRVRVGEYMVVMAEEATLTAVRRAAITLH